jgi:hypothetical protein
MPISFTRITIMLLFQTRTIMNITKINVKVINCVLHTAKRYCKQYSHECIKNCVLHTAKRYCKQYSHECIKVFYTYKLCYTSQNTTARKNFSQQYNILNRLPSSSLYVNLATRYSGGFISSGYLPADYLI